MTTEQKAMLLETWLELNSACELVQTAKARELTRYTNMLEISRSRMNDVVLKLMDHCKS